MSDAPNIPELDPNRETPPAAAPPVAQAQPVVRVTFNEQSPFVTYSIMAVTIGIFLVQMYTLYNNGIDIPALYLMKYNERIMGGEWWRLITPLLVHANLIHIGFNMFALRAFGVGLEGFYGHWRFFLLYLATGFTGVAASFALTANPSVGASTALFGLLGANGALAYQNQRIFGPRARRVFNEIVRIAVLNLLIGLTPGIDNWGHIGGLIGGIMIGWFGGPVYRLGGSTTEMRLENQRTPTDFLLGAGLTVLAFGVVILGKAFLLN